jgi:GAF domain-containing protein
VTSHASTADGQARKAEAGAATELARHLADIAAVLLVPGSVAAVAERIVRLSLATLDSCDEAALCTEPDLVADELLRSDLAARLDDLQTQLSQGPCVDSLGGQDAVYVADLEEDLRWPDFSPAATGLGIRSALAYRLAAEGATVGALQLFAHLPGAFNAYERAQGLIFATYAGTALSLALTQQADQERIENLRQALSSREIIGQAQGILMERERITADQAFELLRRASQRLNLKLRTVAQELVDTGAVPEPLPED